MSTRMLAVIESEFYENNEKWSVVDESIIGGIPRSSERDRGVQGKKQQQNWCTTSVSGKR
jgi:hypothetical protein